MATAIGASLEPSRARLRHPGAEVAPRRRVAPCAARPKVLRFRAGETLLDAITREMGRLGGDGAVARLDGLRLGACQYVIPAGPRDAAHAAWYSDVYSGEGARLENATAMVGLRDGAWFVHCHAVWRDESGAPVMGHLFCDQTRIAEDAEAPCDILSGARLEVAPDPETNFSLFQPVSLPSAPTGPAARANAAVLTIRPHEDLRATLEQVCAELGWPDARVHGIGSLIGARFVDAPTMASPISETLLLDGARVADGVCAALPVVCVDPERRTWRGDLRPGGGAVCVTFELLIVAAANADVDADVDAGAGAAGAEARS